MSFPILTARLAAEEFPTVVRNPALYWPYRWTHMMLCAEVSMIKRLFAIAVDVMVIGITWAKAHRQIKDIHDLQVSESVSMIMLRDGTTITGSVYL